VDARDSRPRETPVDELLLRALAARVAAGRQSRRAFIRAMAALGIGAPLASQMLGGAAAAQSSDPEFTPTRRGGGGTLRLLLWQAPTILNPHLSSGVKDLLGARIFYEPLADFDRDGNLRPALAAEIPSVDNGGVARDATWVTWKLKPGVVWHDGRPLTADDVIFTWEYAADAATSATTIGVYRDLQRVERLNDHGVRVVFRQPTPFWAEAFCGDGGLILPRHVMAPYRGGRSGDAPANLRPVGTGPYRVVDFKPGDLIRAEINASYHVPNRPFFDVLEVKGGGDAVSAARAVLQTSEYDFAWNTQVEDDILRRLESGGRGRLVITPGTGPEHIQLNRTDPWTEMDGERSSVKTVHPTLGDAAVRGALNLLVDRAGVQEQIYGRLARTTANFLDGPPRFASPNTRWEFSVDKAGQLLDAADWKRGPDGVRVKDGRRLKLLFQTSANAPRQKTQAIVKQACARAGIELELKSVVSSVFFGADAGNPDTARRFTADLQMFQLLMGGPDPQRFMESFASWQVATRANRWSGSNTTRWRSDEYDRLWRAAEAELDPVKRAALFIRMNDLVIRDVVVIPVVWRGTGDAVSTRLRGVDITPWSVLSRLAYWHRV
jgi:peptide/nickel transport system substrate-binding protein